MKTTTTQTLNSSRIFRLPLFLTLLLTVYGSNAMFINDFELVSSSPDFSLQGRIVTQTPSGNISEASELNFFGMMFGYDVDFDISHLFNDAPFFVLPNGNIVISFLRMQQILPNGARLNFDFQVGSADCFDTISNVACGGNPSQAAGFIINRTVPIPDVSEPTVPFLLFAALFVWILQHLKMNKKYCNGDNYFAWVALRGNRGLSLTYRAEKFRALLTI